MADHLAPTIDSDDFIIHIPRLTLRGHFAIDHMPLSLEFLGPDSPPGPAPADELLEEVPKLLTFVDRDLVVQEQLPVATFEGTEFSSLDRRVEELRYR